MTRATQTSSGTRPACGTAIATLDGLQLLARANFQCRAFCASKLDTGNWTEQLRGAPGRRRIGDRLSVIGGAELRNQRLAISSDGWMELTCGTVGELPIQIFPTESLRIDQWLPGEPEEMLAAFERVLADFRPDISCNPLSPDSQALQDRCQTVRYDAALALAQLTTRPV
jgi:hypothetical protein